MRRGLLHVTRRLSVASSRWSSRSARCWWSKESHVGRRPRVSRWRDLAAQTALLESKALAEVGGNASLKRTRITIAVKAGFHGDMVSASVRRSGVLLDVRIGDRTIPARLLRRCGDRRGDHRERNGARLPGAPAECATYQWPAGLFVQRHLSDGFHCRRGLQTPSLAWNHDDGLQDMVIT